MNNAQLLRDSEPIRLLETPRPLSEYTAISKNVVGENDECQLSNHRQPKLASLQTAVENLNAL